MTPNSHQDEVSKPSPPTQIKSTPRAQPIKILYDVSIIDQGEASCVGKQSRQERCAASCLPNDDERAPARESLINRSRGANGLRLYQGLSSSGACSLEHWIAAVAYGEG